MTVRVTYPGQTVEEAGRRIDGDEREAAIMGCRKTLDAAVNLQGFDDWSHVVKCARRMHPAAIELLARRVERGEL